MLLSDVDLKKLFFKYFEKFYWLLLFLRLLTSCYFVFNFFTLMFYLFKYEHKIFVLRTFYILFCLKIAAIIAVIAQNNKRKRWETTSPVKR